MVQICTVLYIKLCREDINKKVKFSCYLLFLISELHAPSPIHSCTQMWPQCLVFLLSASFVSAWPLYKFQLDITGAVVLMFPHTQRKQPLLPLALKCSVSLNLRKFCAHFTLRVPHYSFCARRCEGTPSYL